MSEQTGPDAAGSLFDHYALGVAWDEMLAEPGAPRTAYKPVFHTLRGMNAGTLKERADTAAGMRAQRAHGEKTARDGNAETAVRRASDDRPGHALLWQSA